MTTQIQQIQQIQANDIVGNTVQGFRFKVVEISNSVMTVQNIVTGEVITTTTDNMYKHGTRKY